MKKLSGLILLFAILTPALYAQADTIHLEDIHVTARRFDSRIKTAVGGISILQPTETEDSRIINSTEILQNVPGIYVGSGTSTTNRITIRGIGSRTPYSTNRIRVYFEDVPLTDGSGISSIEDMDLNAVSRIEVLKGPASAIYGSGLGGIIILKAYQPGKPGISGIASSSLESYNTMKHSVRLGWKNATSSLVTGYSFAQSQGYRENNEFSRNFAYANAKHSRGKNEFGLLIFASAIDAEIPSSINAENFNSNPRAAAANWLNVNGKEINKKLNTSFNWNYNFNHSLRSELVLFGQLSNPYEIRPFNILDDQSVISGLRESLYFSKGKIELSSGIELFTENYDWKIFNVQDGGEQGILELHNAESRNYGNAFVYSSSELSEKLVLEAGFNLNVLNYRLKTLYNYENADQTGNYRYHPVLSPRAGINYQLSEKINMHLSAGHGFSAPSLEETLLPEGQINPDLKPESGWNIEVGIRGSSLADRWNYELGIYQIFLQNMLVTKRVTEEIFSGINAGAATLKGIEGYTDFRFIHPGSDWQLNGLLGFNLGSNQFTDFIDEGENFSGNVIPGIPGGTLHASVRSAYKNTQLILEGKYTGEQYLRDNNNGISEAYFLVNLQLSQEIKNIKKLFSVNISAYLNNLLDTHYASMILVNAPSFGGAAPRYYYPGLPRNAGISLILKF